MLILSIACHDNLDAYPLASSTTPSTAPSPAPASLTNPATTTPSRLTMSAPPFLGAVPPLLPSEGFPRFLNASTCRFPEKAEAGNNGGTPPFFAPPFWPGLRIVPLLPTEGLLSSRRGRPSV